MEMEVRFEEINREFEAEFEGYIVKAEGNGGYDEGFNDGKQEAYDELNDISVALDEIIAMQEELIGL